MSNQEQLKASAVGFGFDPEWVAQILEQWGPDVLAVVVEAARQGLSVTTVVDILTKLGPKLLDLLISVLNKMKMMGVAGDVVGGDVVQGVDSAVVDVLVEKWLPVIIQKYLPMIIDKYGPQLIQFVIDFLLKSLNK